MKDPREPFYYLLSPEQLPRRQMRLYSPPKNVYEHLCLTRFELASPGYHTVSLRNIISAKSSPVMDCLLFSSTMPIDDITRSAGVEVACTERYFLANLKRQ